MISDYLLFLLYVVKYYKEKIPALVKYTLSFPLREIEIPDERLEIIDHV